MRCDFDRRCKPSGGDDGGSGKTCHVSGSDEIVFTGNPGRVCSSAWFFTAFKGALYRTAKCEVAKVTWIFWQLFSSI